MDYAGNVLWDETIGYNERLDTLQVAFLQDNEESLKFMCTI